MLKSNRLYSIADIKGMYRANDVIKASSRCAVSRCVSTDVTSAPQLKQFSRVPGPRCLPLIGTLWDFLKPNGLRFNKLFEAMKQRSEQYGPVYRETIGRYNSIVVSDLDEYAKVIAVDGRYPHRTEMEPYLHYMKKRGVQIGIVNRQGEEWHGARRVLSRKMLPLSEVLPYVDVMNQVADDFILRLHRVRHQLADPNHSAVRLENELFHWALESIGCVLFEERIGCFNDPPPEPARQFINSLSGFFKYQQPLFFGLPTYKLFPTKTWRLFEAYTDNLLYQGQQFVGKVV